MTLYKKKEYLLYSVFLGDIYCFISTTESFGQLKVTLAKKG